MDSIAKIKAIYSSLIEGIIPKAEEILERIVGGQVIIDVDWDTFTNGKNELRALQVMEENLFKALIRAMHVNMETLAVDPIYEIHITNIPGGSVASKWLQFRKMKMEYHGAFEAGSAGCFTEDELRLEIGNRGNKDHSSPASPRNSSLVSNGEASAADRIAEFRNRRKSTVGQLKKEFQEILKAEIEDQVLAESQQASPETLSHLVAQKQKDAEDSIKKEMFTREKKLCDYVPRQVDPKTEKIKKLERDIQEKEIEIEIEERECGDVELISMLQTQVEIMKSLLADELDEQVVERDIEFSGEDVQPAEEKRIPSSSLLAPLSGPLPSPLPSPVHSPLSPRRLVSSNSPRMMSPIDKVKHMTAQSTGSRDSWSSTGSDVDMPVQVVYISEKDTNIKEGYLVKRGAKHKNWKRRWFVLRKKCLLYYKAKEYPYPQGTITPIIATSYVTDDTAKKENTFVISTPVRLFFCAAESHQEMKAWISAIEDEITQETTPNQDNFPHAFNKCHFDTPTKCMYCSFFIWGIGKQGFQCKTCNFVVHKKCLGRVGDNCNPGSTAPSSPRKQAAQKGDRVTSLPTSKKKETSVIKGKR